MAGQHAGPDLLTILRLADLTVHGRMSDVEIAEELGVNRRTLSRWRRFEDYQHFVRGFSAYTHRRLLQNGCSPGYSQLEADREVLRARLTATLEASGTSPV